MTSTGTTLAIKEEANQKSVDQMVGLTTTVVLAPLDKDSGQTRAVVVPLVTAILSGKITNNVVLTPGPMITVAPETGFRERRTRKVALTPIVTTTTNGRITRIVPTKEKVVPMISV